MNGYIIGSAAAHIGGCRFKLLRILNGKDCTDDRTHLAVSHSHLFYELLFVREGTCEFHLQHKNVLVHAGEMIIIEPERLHYSYSGFEGNAAARVDSLALTLSRAGEDDGVYDRFRSMLDDCAERAVAVPPALVENVRAFAFTPDGSIESLCEEKITVCRIIELLSSCCGEARKKDIHAANTGDANETEMLFDCLVNNPDATVESIADALHYSPKQISRLVVKNYGMTLGQLQNQRRFETALMLLDEYASLPVKEIAQRAGYGTLGTFYRCFRDRMGMTPEDYRRKCAHVKDSKA